MITPPPEIETPAPASLAPTQPRQRSAEGLPPLTLSDFLDFRRLRKMQRAFRRITRLSVSIRDAQGQELRDQRKQPPSLPEMVSLPVAVNAEHDPCAYEANIQIEGQQLGTIRIQASGKDCHVTADRLRALGHALGVEDQQVQQVVDAADEAYTPSIEAALHLVYLWANGITRACYQEYESRQRVEELSTLYKLSTVLSAHRNVQEVLDTACRETAAAMHMKAASIRLLGNDGVELLLKSVYNLSDAYLSKGRVLASQSELYQRALEGKVVYVEDMATDPRVIYPEFARREGLASILAAGMIYQGKPVGVIRLYTGEKRRFTQFEVNLLKAIAQFTAAAIETARMHADYEEAQRVQRQLRLAADVQRRMLPSAMPHMPPFDIAARYVPSAELSGDFFDFISLDGHLGIAVADVVGKGVPASLLMASARASLRAYAQDVYDIDEIVARVNVALSRDTRDNEFVTMFYGVLDPQTRRLTYCNAGHEPPLLLRDGQITSLTAGGMIAGIDEHQRYEKGLVILQPGDLLLIYTDGLSEAFNFAGQKFGKQRIIEAMHQSAHESAQRALNHVLWQMRRFVGLNHTPDDLTLVCVKVTNEAAMEVDHAIPPQA